VQEDTVTHTEPEERREIEYAKPAIKASLKSVGSPPPVAAPCAPTKTTAPSTDTAPASSPQPAETANIVKLPKLHLGSKRSSSAPSKTKRA
jgi:hypothetical protein